MRPRTLLILAILLLPLAVAAYRATDPGTSAPRHAHLGRQLFTDWPVVRISAITVTHGEGSVTLEKEEARWTVAERFNHPADFEKIADLVRRIGDSRVGSAFELFPDTLSRLALHDPAAPDVPELSKGLRVAFRDAEGAELLAILLGRSREGAAAGHYLMPVGGVLGYLVDQDFRGFGGRPVDWIDRALADVPPETIRQVVGRDPRTGRPLYTLVRPAPDREPVWTAAAPDDDVREERIDAAFRALINLSAEDVIAPVDNAWSDRFDAAGPQLVYYLYDGTVYTVHPGPPLPGKGADRNALRIRVSHAPQAGADPDAPARATALDARLAPWVYAVSAWRHGYFVRDPSELAEPESGRLP